MSVFYLTCVIAAFLLVGLGVAVCQDRIRLARRTAGEVRLEGVERSAIEAKLALLTGHSTDAVFRIDLQGECRYASSSAREILGSPPEALVGRQMLTHFHPDDRRSVYEAFKGIVEGTAERGTVTARARKSGADKGWMWLEASLGVIRGAVGHEPVEVAASVRNVSQRKELEIELGSARERAEEAVIVKSSFLANMSHEIRTPMNGVIGFTELLLASDLNAEQRHQAQLIADSGRAMMRLLNDILDLSRLDAGQMDVCSEPFDLAHALRNCMQLITPAVSQKGIQLKCEISTELPRLVAGDGLRLRQIVLNLLGNAAKFTFEGSITLRASPLAGAGGQVIIQVEDTGIGIANDRQPAIFMPFVQADNRTASRFGGSGLGLTISDQLARLMGGSLGLESEPGLGSCFSLTLPLPAAVDRRGDGRADDTGAYDPAAEPRHLTHVLVAEDHDVNQLLITAMLKELGCQVDVAKDGAEALKMVIDAASRDVTYGVVLMDMRMPEMDGLETTRRIRACGFEPQNLPIVALTANAYADDVAACVAAGMQGHLAKPIKLADLRAALLRWTSLRLRSATTASGPRLSPKVRDRYRARKAETLNKLEELMRLGRLEDADLTEVIDLLHKLAGTAQMFGDGKLGDEARLLEVGMLNWPRSERAQHIPAAIEAMQVAA